VGFAREGMRMIMKLSMVVIVTAASIFLMTGVTPADTGQEVAMVLNENNNVIDVHLQGAEGAHSFVTGKLIHVGKMKPEIKLQTPQGDKTFPLVRQDVKTGGTEKGALRHGGA
jgi:hypothetical protein